MVRGLSRRSINPNLLTVTGVSINVLCGLMFGLGHFFWAGVILIVANLFDMLDGSVARLTGRVTRFGGFLDSSLDRLSDMAVFAGLLIFYARDTEFHSTLNVFLTVAAMIGSVLVSYASARAESIIEKCDVGFLRRPERVVLLIIGALSTHHGSASVFANRMPAVLWILAVGSYWTFAYRMYHTWYELNYGAASVTPTQAAAGHNNTTASDSTRAQPNSPVHARDGASTTAGEASNAGPERHGAPELATRAPAAR